MSHYAHKVSNVDIELGSVTGTPVPLLAGIPLKYISLVTLAFQNSLLTIMMHYSRISTSPSETYSAATAVLLSELLKGAVSLTLALPRNDRQFGVDPQSGYVNRLQILFREVFSSDCWKLAVPATLYVIQNNLQYVAISNLDAATFQVTYQMKILTTAGFSVLLLRKQLRPLQWTALLILAVGVAVVQIQSVADSRNISSLYNSHMDASKGFLAVVAATVISGLAGVYFEMVLKNTQSDLWVRNIQLSMFSLLPAILPVIVEQHSADAGGLLDHFGFWAWATVIVQALGGLITAIVVKYSDNIMKGFATSISILISFLASVILFNFGITFNFVLGGSAVLAATYLYSLPAKEVHEGDKTELLSIASTTDFGQDREEEEHKFYSAYASSTSTLTSQDL